MQIERITDAARLNAVVNDPSVYPWVRGTAEGPLDLGGIIADPRHVALMGAHGGCLFVHHQPGIFEAHTQVLESGRGPGQPAASRTDGTNSAQSSGDLARRVGSASRC